jgi:uncharacterized membrane protein
LHAQEKKDHHTIVVAVVAVTAIVAVMAIVVTDINNTYH